MVAAAAPTAARFKHDPAVAAAAAAAVAAGLTAAAITGGVGRGEGESCAEPNISWGLRRRLLRRRRRNMVLALGS